MNLSPFFFKTQPNIASIAMGDQTFLDAAADGDLAAMRRTYGRGVRNVNEAILWAAKNGQLAAMRLLHDEWGAERDNEALVLAAEGGHLAAMRLAHDEWGATYVNDALHRAALYGRLDAMYLLHDEWGALPSAIAITGKSYSDYSNETQDLMDQWASPAIKSAMKK